MTSEPILILIGVLVFILIAFIGLISLILKIEKLERKSRRMEIDLIDLKLYCVNKGLVPEKCEPVDFLFFKD